MELIPLTQSEAKAFIAQHHRHHKPPVGSIFQIGLTHLDEVVGVVVVGRPVSRHLQDGWTAEVTRLCTTGIKNACSMLYAAAWRAARAMGYKRLITYILDTEPGTSLEGAGWKCVGKTKGGSWNCHSRPRVDKHPTQMKLKWMVELQASGAPR